MSNKYPGFTIVELLIVVVIIGILSTITVVAYSGITKRAQLAKISHDVGEIAKAAILARDIAMKPLGILTGQGYGVGGPMTACWSYGDSSLQPVAYGNACWNTYNYALDVISQTSGINVRGLVDPWGRPYLIATFESSRCWNDVIGAWPRPMSGQSAMDGTAYSLPMSGYSSC